MVEEEDIQLVIAPASDILACSIDQWHPLFSRNSPRTVIIPLPDRFIEYLHQDGVILPKSAKLSQLDDTAELGVQDEDNEDNEDKEEASDDEEQVDHPEFPELDQQIDEALTSLGGSACIKLNWSAPTDAVWVSGTLKCQTAGDIYLLLKSSDRITYDLEHMFDECGGSSQPIQWHLAVRKWCNLHPSMGFRCFVRAHKLFAICQRDCTRYFDFLAAQLPDIEETIANFFTKRVKNVFTLEQYTMDVYVDKNHRVWIIDFNPFGEPTCPLLFTWPELCDISDEIRNEQAQAQAGEAEAEGHTAADNEQDDDDTVVEFRIVESDSEVLKSTLGSTRGPVDTPHVGDPSEFEGFMRRCVRDQNRAESDDGHNDGDNGVEN